MNSNEFQSILNKLELLNEKLEAYTQANNEITTSIKGKTKVYQNASQHHISLSLGVLVVAAITTIISLTIS